MQTTRNDSPMAAAPKNNTPDRDAYLRITRPASECLLCSAPLNVDGRHPTVLEAADTEEVIRKDFCPKCWASMQDGGYFSFWVTKRVNAPSAKERRLARAERNEALWRLFSALYAGDSRSEMGPQLFLLAHLLMKYRVLVYTGRGEGEILRFAHPKLGESFEVPDVPLDGADFVAIKAALEEQALNYVPTPGAEDDAPTAAPGGAPPPEPRGD